MVMYVVRVERQGHQMPRPHSAGDTNSCRYPFALNLYIPIDLNIKCFNCPSLLKLPQGSGDNRPKRGNAPLVGCTFHARHLAENHVTEARKRPAKSQLFGLWSLDIQPPTGRHLA